MKMMTSFTTPIGINFRSPDDLPASELAKQLCRIVCFLQNIEPYVKLQKYDDWWEHDGLHFHRVAIDFEGLFGIVGSPRKLLEAMPGDEDVCIGVAPHNNSWYLRFYLGWDEEGINLQGKFDITVAEKLVERFRNEVARQAGIELKEQDAEAYYRSIKL
jgi:hypothetical protein